MYKKFIIKETNDIIYLNKIPRLLVHKDKTNDITLIDYINNKNYKPINRIDRPASGIIVIGKNEKIIKKLNKLYKDKKINKTYICLVNFSNFNINNLKGFHNGGGIYNDSKLYYEVLNINKKINVSSLKINIKTGRKHQIRRQLSELNLPILGDHKYKKKNDYNNYYKVGKHIIALHAKEINIFNEKIIASYPKEWLKHQWVNELLIKNENIKDLLI